MHRRGYPKRDDAKTTDMHLFGTGESPYFVARDGSLVRCDVRCGVPYIQDRAVSEDEERELRRMTGSRVRIAARGDEKGRHIVGERLFVHHSAFV